ncbi:glyoxalase [Nocardioides sp. dk4132]|uniref:VOC family protein n=1 Tax=unclassified Nocardioides TaxID=2615069 RepID=UPI00129728B9|nr:MULTISPECIES: VOC family protein [unclassified Nocardioides]MQW77444.1 glyoxalase [Nocardioides sp. dk4132]QGA09249.1 glyoxalase [Nocardioides sp. dk884]
MSAKVKALGYAVISTENLDDWVEFGSNLLGLQVAYRDEDRLLLRMDHYAYRIDVRRGEPGATALGWDVGSREALAELAGKVAAAGYTVEQGSPELLEERKVMDLVRFRDAEDIITHELFWGLRSSTQKFVSPIGANFVAGEMGFGHAFQALHHGQEKYDELFRDILGFRLSDHIDMPGDVGTFLHCNPRHHSLAYANAPHRKQGIGHLMFEIDDLDTLGRAWDAVQDAGVTILSTLGKHTNDEMISFYVRSPSGFGIEFGVGGILIDDETWLPVRYDSAHYWGHKRPEGV